MAQVHEADLCAEQHRPANRRVRAVNITCVTILFLFFLVVAPIGGVAAAGQSKEASGWSYNSDYIYGMTRGIRDNHDASAGVKITIMPVTILLDTVLLPVALIAGLFGQPQ